MDLKTFISETLKQVIAGVKEAQEGEGGGSINAESGVSGGHLTNSGTFGVFTRVDFDVAVSAETSGGGKGGISVLGIGVEGSGQHKQGHMNKISFSVPIRLPDGDRQKTRR